MPKRISLKRMKVTITLPEYLLDAIDELVNMVGGSRSNVIEAFSDYCMKHEEIVDELFPYEEEAEEEKEPEDEGD